MEPLDGSQISSDLTRELDVLSEEERDISPSRKHQKRKEKRKASSTSLREGGKTKNR